jgi:arginase
MCKKLKEVTHKSSSEGNFTIILGGDHGLASGSIYGIKEAHPDLKVVWVDAHGDCNTPEASPSGNYHGMPVAHLLGWFGEEPLVGFEWFKPILKPEDIVYIALRDVDDFEKYALKKHNIKVFDMEDVTELGIGEVMNRALSYLNPIGSKNPIHLSFDIDAIDPQYAPQTGTPARGGLSYREAHYIVRKLAKTGQLVSMDLVEINTELYKDSPKKKFLHGDSHIIDTDSETLALGVELIGSALGHRICL